MANLLKKSMCIFSATKKRKLFCLLIVFYFAALIFAANDAWLYKTPVVKVTEAHTVKERTAEAARGKKDVYYKQVLHGVVLNGKWKSSSIILRNEYSSSGVLNQKYRKGDNILASVNGHSQTGDIQGLKRDVHLTALIGILSILLIFLTEKKGILTICTLVVNLGIFAVGLSKFLKGDDIQAMQEDVMYFYNVDIHINMLHIAVCICLLSTLGAVLDTTLSITSSVYEVAVHNKDLSRRKLYHSGLQIGKEIIGTTTNTLLFAYFGESMLLFAYLKTGKFTFETIINCKFLFQGVAVMLFGGIACLLAVPVALVCIAHFIRPKETIS